MAIRGDFWKLLIHSFSLVPLTTGARHPQGPKGVSFLMHHDFLLSFNLTSCEDPTGSKMFKDSDNTPIELFDLFEKFSQQPGSICPRSGRQNMKLARLFTKISANIAKISTYFLSLSSCAFS